MAAISVLVRTLGRQAALKDALDSLARQTCGDFEAVVVEDGPATLESFISGYAGFPVRYEALGANRGRSVAGNRALALAKGEYCLFLDEDDLLHPDHLRSLLDGARAANSAIAYSWSQVRFVERGADGAITKRGRFTRTRRERFSLLHLVAGNFMPTNAVLFRRALYERAGGFDEDIECLEDWLLWVRYAALAPDWLCVPRATAIYHVPLALAARRGAFRQWHGKVRERMGGIVAQWPMDVLSREMQSHFRAAVFLRKLYYFLTGYL